ncbi:MAG: Hsp20/alpha crystallin family protein [Candidatus Methylomirabilales bacterium]
MRFPKEDGEFEKLRSSMVELMKALSQRGRPTFARGSRFEPAMDVYETNAAIVIVMEIAGTQRKDIDIQLEGSRLRIAGGRRVTAPLDAQGCHQMEIEFGHFERWVTLDFFPPRDTVEAVYQDGLLRITIPKRGDPKATTVQIATE